MLELLIYLFLPLLGTINSTSFPEVLSAEDEAYYLERWKNKDFEARNTLIEHNMRLVAHIVKKFENCREDKDDLLSIGSFGLIKAIDTYNFNVDTKLATYAAKCIENEILMHLRANKRKKQTTGLYTPIGQDKDGNEIQLYDVIEDPSPSSIERLISEEHISQLLDALKILNEREYDIIMKRFGLNNSKVMTQIEIAKSMKISRSYVSRIEKRALTKLYLELKNRS